ncbi:MAG: hypothetical protein HZA88_00605 [Verrucomicrobia bacterium]|nr:hypothetical protein [Verrucomicrobiota bacterium]
MSADTTIRGTGQIQEDDQSPKFSFKSAKDTCTRTFRCAVYATLEAVVPEVGASMSSVEATFTNARSVKTELKSGFVVTDRDLQPEKGGKGVLTVTFERSGGTSIYSYPDESNVSSSAVSSDPTPPTEYGCEWTEVSKPIEQNPYFATIATDDALLALVEDALNERDAAKRAALLDKIAAGDALGTALYEKKRKGETHYTIYAPVAEKISYSDSDPGTNGCGQIEAPPAEIGAPGTYSYRKTADKKHWNGTRWQRTEQWTGADVWDSDLYD